MMAASLRALSSSAGAFALLAALAWAPVTGFPTWPALARGRMAGTLAITFAVASFTYAFARAAVRQT